MPGGWRRAHPEQPLGGPDGCRTRQHGGSGLKSTTGACRGGSSPWIAQGGCYIKNQVRDPILRVRSGAPAHFCSASRCIFFLLVVCASPLRRRWIFLSKRLHLQKKNKASKSVLQGWWVNVNTLLLDYTQDTGPTLTPNPLLTRSNTSPETGVNPVLTRC